MIFYFDTSALAKRYILEEGSEAVRNLVERAHYIETSALTELELISLFERCRRERKVDSPTCRKLVSFLERDIHNSVFSLASVPKSVWREAKRLIRQRKLRVADSLQLASALEALRRLRGTLHFVCADRQLVEVARLEGLRCIDPR